MKMKPVFKTYLIPAVGLVLAGVLAYLGITCARRNLDVTASGAEISPARIAEVRRMARLCSIEFYRELPMRDSIGTKHIFARRKIQGQITFDVDSLQLDATGDTVRIVLPRERVVVRESTEPDSYEIVDVWNSSVFGSSRLSNSEENLFKRRHDRRIMSTLYADGTVTRARRDAATNLARMISILYGRPAMVVIRK